MYYKLKVQGGKLKTQCMHMHMKNRVTKLRLLIKVESLLEKIDIIILYVFLSEMDVPGASLNGKEVSSLKIPELKPWLQCHRAPTMGKKADLVARLIINLVYAVWILCSVFSYFL